ncbi:hypothetical protein PHJA_000388900 [Phtheirospermum japonicum]|uniref:Uncharacterized protein n=1 Tax=Phtheirospermum japonicum TaxID=374723 RepID=A0A830BB69_9LAMI|nr:hypothetical protein PHJA_000388900 [Phtheirospermum japonicum]
MRLNGEALLLINYSLFLNKTNGCTSMVNLQHVSLLISRCIKQLEYLSRLQFHSSN